MQNTLIQMQKEYIGPEILMFLSTKSHDSSNTAKAYKGDLKQFFEYAFGKEIKFVETSDIHSINFKMLEKYRTDLKEVRAAKNGTINRKIAAIKELLKYLKNNGLIDVDISFLQGIKSLKDDSTPHEVLSIEQSEDFAEFMKTEKFKSTEKFYLIKLAIDTGLREDELLKLSWSAFLKNEDGTVSIKGRGKGKKRFHKVIGNNLYNELVENLKTPDNEEVFTLSEKNLWDMMNRAKEQLGFQGRKIVFHSFRKAAVNFGYKRMGNDLLHAKSIANHSSINTTLKYLDTVDYGITGAISLKEDTNDDLFREIEHSDLLQIIEEMNPDIKLLINLKIKEQLFSQERKEFHDCR